VRPFTDERLERLRDKVRELARALPPRTNAADAARFLADAGLYKLCVPSAFGGAAEGVSPLALVVAREVLAGAAADCDSALAVQALVALPVWWAGTKEQRERWLPALASGQELGAFALTEAGSGSDAGALETRAAREGDGYRLEGAKVLISGARAATVLLVFARTGGAGSERPVSAFLVPRGAAGLAVEDTPNLGEHALATVTLSGVRVPEGARLGAEGDGLGLSLRTLELLRPTVGAAACGMAARALDEARDHARKRVRGGAALTEHESVRMKLAEMATDLEAARLLVYRAAWLRETTAAGTRLPAEASMAKLFATEAAGRIVDAALQLHGGAGVVTGSVIERLYREVRALRIYEGTSEIQKLIIARTLD
jgi:acyl-CoA dehydrogenase